MYYYFKTMRWLYKCIINYKLKLENCNLCVDDSKYFIIKNTNSINSRNLNNLRGLYKLKKKEFTDGIKDFIKNNKERVGNFFKNLSNDKKYNKSDKTKIDKITCSIN